MVGEIVYGIGVGWLSLRLRQWAHNPRVEITLSLMTPYLAYWVPEHLGGSGVLATVAAGLYVSWNGPRLIPAATRLQGIFFWDLIIYLIEGFVFLVTGLQARTLIEKAPRFPGRANCWLRTAITAAIAIVARFVWMFPATYLPRWLIPPLAHDAIRRRRGSSAFISALHRRARRGLACRSARHSSHDQKAARRFRIATSSCSSPSASSSSRWSARA